MAVAVKPEALLGALQRGRGDVEFFGRFFLGRKWHAGQLEYLQNANAKVNVLACANRYGKTTILSGIHFHSCIYKTGAERSYLDEDGAIDPAKFVRTKYETAHTAGEWEQAALTWQDALKLIAENPERLEPFVTDYPRSKPPHISFLNGSKWLFRTLGANASGIDGKSLHELTIDEAGWIADLDTMMTNVLKIRTADVRGRIHIVGTFKPGVSKDFYKISVRAGAYTGVGLSFDHRSAEDEQEARVGTMGQRLDDSIRRYLADFGIDLEEYKQALRG